MPLDIAFVGLKGHWHGIAQELAQRTDTRCIAVADDQPDLLERVPEIPGLGPEARRYLTCEEMLANELPDLVVEAGTDGARAEVIRACAERGIHLIVEKPLAKELAELDRVQAAVKANGIVVSMLLTMRCEPVFLAMREAVRRGDIGELCQAAAQKSYKLGTRPAWQKSRTTFSGTIPFVGIHAMDLLRWVSGREFTEVFAFASNVAHPEVGDLEDNACVLARLDNGASAAIRLDYCRPAGAPTHGDDRLRLAGDRGVLETQDGIVTFITADAGPQQLPLPEPLPFLADYLAAVSAGRPPLVSFPDCVRITEVVLRARESAELGRPARL